VKGCTSLHEILIPHAVKTIKDGSFCWCTQIMSSVVLGEGLEEIGVKAFNECTSLHEITISHAVTRIKYGAFGCCSRLNIVNLGEGVEENWAGGIQ
jgi:hypothetical protein